MHFSDRSLSAIQQWIQIQSAYPGVVGAVHCGSLECRLWLQPTLVSRPYLARLRFRDGGSPKVWVEDPDLSRIARDRVIPHLYDHKKIQLCLYHPSRFEWSAKMPIAKTIIPWTCLWLYFFEDWLITGEWHGGGEHPKLKPKDT